MVRDSRLVLFVPQFCSHTAPAPSSFSCRHQAIANIPLDSSCKLRCVFVLSFPPFPISVYSPPPPLPSTALPPSKSTICCCIHGSSPTKSTQTPSAASCPTQTLLTQTLATACSASRSIARSTASTLPWRAPQLHAVTQPVLHSTVIRWDLIPFESIKLYRM